MLLLWADREPVERRGVMLLTMGVFAGNALCGGYAAASGLVEVAVMVPSWIAQVGIILLLGFSYLSARSLGRAHPHAAV